MRNFYRETFEEYNWQYELYQYNYEFDNQGLHQIKQELKLAHPFGRSSSS